LRAELFFPGFFFAAFFFSAFFAMPVIPFAFLLTDYHLPGALKP